MSATKTKRFECALCGMPRVNDESVLWLGPTWDDRKPYCADDCARYIERDLRRRGV